MEELGHGEGSRVKVVLLAEGECAVEHTPSGARLRTSTPKAFGGTGSSFSATDLLAAALGSCIATDLGALADRHGVAAGKVKVEVEKTLSQRPKRLEALHVSIRLPDDVGDDVALRFQRAAEQCLVRRSLTREISVRVSFSSG